LRLKSLEIKGFKSFADKTLILLDHAVTGVVGPNGCGKSNIVDAIRWVIGEHKIKSLRSDNLDDLIFNGSKSRPASSMAEVSLTFENTRNLLPTEFSTVTITRKFYKSGESEYRLNDVSCRLKDIHNLFMDTGVSSDSYAIIELGMVDDIIKDKEGSRRRMLEQAAGISIYKTRKKEAKQKLEGTQSDISRIDDLLFEISNNLRTLESQARKAERYLQIKNDYKTISIELAKASLEEYNDKYQGLNAQLTAEQDKKLKIESEISGDEAEIEANKLLLVQKEQELSKAQKQFNELLNRIRALESEKKLAAQHLTHLQEQEHNLKKLLENAASQLQLLQQSVEGSNKQLGTETEALEDLRDQLDHLRDSLEEKRASFDQHKQQLETQRKGLQEVQMKQFDHEKKVAVADTSLANLQRSIFQAETEKNNRINQVNDLKRTLEETKIQKAQKEEDLQTLLTEQHALQENISAEQSVLEQLKEESVDQNRKLDARRNEHDLLKSLVDSLEGYPDSIKFLRRNKEWNYDAPLLSDIFVVKDEYRVALETVLDQYLNYYVVRDLNEAATATALLEKNKKGKANFFLLDRFPEQPAKTPSVFSNLKPALETVDVEPQYQALAQYLLGNVYIAEAGETLQEKLPADVLLIEKSGTLLRGKYSLSGGSAGLFTGNKIGRARNLEKLKTEIASLKDATALLSGKISESQNAMEGFRNALKNKNPDNCRNELNQISNKAINLQARIEHFEQLNTGSEEHLAGLREQLEENREGLQDSNEYLAGIREQMAALQAGLQTAEAAFASIEQDYNLASQQYNNQNIQLTRQQSKIESLKQEIVFRNNQIKELQQQETTNKTQLRETASKISETSGKLHFGDNELYDLLEQKEKDEKNLNEKDREYYAFRNALNEHEQKISRQRREKEQAETLLNAFKEKLSEMKLQVAGIKERLSVEFKVELENILEEERTTALSLEELNAEADRLKKKLENIGEVNPTAIEAYQEIKIRHDFIVEQKSDLENARDTLLQTIEEVERTANARFKETFDQVSINFEQVFKALFSEEDKASLKLTDPENVAESGIEIYAQPKGKRPSTLTQLSGGEKTLTSTAFLFAIYLIKPAPFCILDEVDAPLDDANVGKFTQMIRKFSDNSQFIIVTHNKQTMASVDVIYGVTMQEVGISKLVPVDFRSLV
jgi:chromosome segregation protein